MDSHEGTDRTRRCVVWHRAGVGAAASEALLTALSSRGLRVETSGSGHEVLGIACAQQQRIDAGGMGLILVLDGAGESDGLEDQDRVLEAMERFCPSGLVWVYEEGANPPLRGVVEKGKATRPVVEPMRRPAIQCAEPPVLRLAGQDEGDQGSTKKPLQTSDVLDQDELAALLKPDEKA